MSSAAFARVARARFLTYRPRLALHQQRPVLAATFSSAGKRLSSADAHHEESFEEFTARYVVHMSTGWKGAMRVRSWTRAGGREELGEKSQSWTEGEYIRISLWTRVLMRCDNCRYEKEFEQVNDVFELQRNLNNAFAYDLVPAPSVIVAALKAARRVNDYPTAVRIFEGKLEKHSQETYVKSRSGACGLIVAYPQASKPKSRTKANTTSTSRNCNQYGTS
jgi:hypothetical protein